MSADDCLGESGLCLELAMSNCCSQAGRDKGVWKAEGKAGDPLLELWKVRT